MMTEYIRLADRINEVFDLDLEPHNENRAFVKLFGEMLSRRDALIACLLDEKLRPSSYVAEEMGISDESAVRALKKMARQGIIFEHKEGRKYTYKLMPFVPGIFEAMVHASGDAFIAECLKEYTEEVRRIGSNDNDFLIPVNSKIEVRTESVPFEEISVYLDAHDSYAVMDCMCRTINKAHDKACGHSIKDMCILIGSSVDYYVRTGKARRAGRAEIEQILRKAESEGLVHEMYPMNKSDSIFICNCCSCGCLFLGLSQRIHSVVTYEGTVRIDGRKCSRCGTCISRCPEQVFGWESDGGIAVDSSRCFECGMCRLICPERAIEIG